MKLLKDNLSLWKNEEDAQEAREAVDTEEYIKDVEEGPEGDIDISSVKAAAFQDQEQEQVLDAEDREGLDDDHAGHV